MSTEALIRRVRRGDARYRINSVVDVNNLISVKSGFSVGSYDLGVIHGSIVFRKAEEGEGYTGIGKDFLVMGNMLVPADDGIFDSSMSDSARAMVTEKAKDIRVVNDCLENDINLEQLLEKAAESFRKFTSATDIKMWVM